MKSTKVRNPRRSIYAYIYTGKNELVIAHKSVCVRIAIKFTHMRIIVRWQTKMEDLSAVSKNSSIFATEQF